MKAIHFFNTYSGKMEEFKPLRAGEVRMYTCGPTVYDYAHIGNFRAYVFEDLLRRVLKLNGLRVTQVMNLTDVDDKTIKGAREKGVSLGEFTKTYSDAFFEDVKTLNIEPAESYPRATDHLAEMIRLIEKLIENGHAYEREGSVYYRVASFKNYGRLSKKDLTQNIAGARVDLDEYEKEAGSDFALWKKKKEGEPAWPSPWGEGRPGWHIECSVMSMKYLGETFDIHTGGEDNIFPHHENEIAQSEGATEKPFVRFWLHCRFLLVDGEKMSKSKGNFYTLRDLLKKGYDPMQIRYVLLSSHYRQPLNFTLKGLEAAKEALERLDHFYARVTDPLLKAPARKAALQPVFQKGIERFEGALSEDLGIPEALAAVFDALREANQKMDKGEFSAEDLGAAKQFLEKADSVLGLKVAEKAAPPEPLLKLLREREEARARKEFARTDEIRREIQKQGWVVKDGRPGEPSQLKRKKRVWESD